MRARCSSIILLVGLLIQPSIADAVDVEQDWFTTYNGPGNHSDSLELLAVAGDGAAVAAGRTYEFGQGYRPVVFRTSPDDTRVWTTILPFPASIYGPDSLVLDHSGDVLLSGGRSVSGTWTLDLVKLDGDTGEVIWEKHIVQGACPAWERSSAEVAIGADNSIHTIGCDLTTTKYAPDGTMLWQHSNGAALGMSSPLDIAVGENGNVYAVGGDLGGQNGFGITAYDATGNVLWDDTQVGPIGSSFGPAWVDVDAAGSIIVSADPETTCGLFSLMLWKYNAAGQFQWRLSYPDNPCDTYTPEGMVVDPNGTTYVTGFRGGSSDIATVAFDGSGNLLWEDSYDGPLGSTDLAFDLTLDDAGNVYVVGEEVIASQDRDFVTISYDPAGTRRWTISFDGPVGGNDRPQAIAVSGCGAVYVAGSGWNPPQNQDGFLLRYLQILSTDLDDDGDTDLEDFTSLQRAFGGTGPHGDVNGDGQVDLQDAAELGQHLAGQCG